ncbi:MAG: hypothetical protein HY020_23175 [Burkholderiales bacterium]|nr:hypothetical protein [Burkholderiales bacterium]
MGAAAGLLRRPPLPAQTQRQPSGDAWQAQLGPQAQPVEACAGWLWVGVAWQPQVQLAPGQFAHWQARVEEACMDVP